MKSAHTARFVAAGVVAALAVATAAPAGAAAPTVDPGVTKSQIVIGTTTPLTGPASPGYKYVAPAAQAYFEPGRRYVREDARLPTMRRRRL